MNRTKILAGNWKLNLGPSEAVQYFEQMSGLLKEKSPTSKRVIFPVAYCLQDSVQRAAKTCGVELGAQNIHWETKGAFTGELSGQTLREMGFSWTLLAHSERRQFFGETDETAARRLKTAITLGLNVVYCIGERLEEREGGRMNEVLIRQTKAYTEVLKTTQPQASQTVCIAYEPVWAIGTGKTATPAQAEEAHAFIRAQLKSALGAAGEKTSLLYGGSVTAQNSKELLSQPNVDGVLVGGASLKPTDFSIILQS